MCAGDEGAAPGPLAPGPVSPGTCLDAAPPCPGHGPCYSGPRSCLGPAGAGGRKPRQSWPPSPPRGSGRTRCSRRWPSSSPGPRTAAGAARPGGAAAPGPARRPPAAQPAAWPGAPAAAAPRAPAASRSPPAGQTGRLAHCHLHSALSPGPPRPHGTRGARAQSARRQRVRGSPARPPAAASLLPENEHVPNHGPCRRPTGPRLT